MTAHDFLAAALGSTIESLGGHEILHIGSHAIPAIIEASTETEDLVMGGEGDHRSCSALCASSDLPEDTPRKGDHVTIRGVQWTINEIEFHPNTSCRINLQSPSRRD